VPWHFWIDRGGTFTDIIARDPGGTLRTAKFLSETPEGQDAALAGIRHMLGLGIGAAIPPGLIASVKMGTTVATNALLQRHGARTLLLVNQGFADCLRIGNQARPKLFDLDIRLPDPLYEQVAEIPGRLDAAGGEITPLDEAAARNVLAHSRAAGMTACAIALMHGWEHPAHEQRLAELAGEAGFTQISASHLVSPLPRLIPRAQTTLVDAYLSPVLRHATQQLRAELAGTRLYFMQSHGGLCDAADFRGKDAILSGPAGGIVGAARTAEQAGFTRIISFDMGGTSTDVALYAGVFDRTLDTAVAGIALRTPMLAINTVAAGGGSILRFDGARLRVGPESAGALPGPAAYGRGGALTVTDANIVLGKIQPAHFPALFGPAGTEPLDAQAARAGFAALAAEIAAATGRAQGIEHLAEGFARIAVTNMANAIRHISVRKGHDVSRFVLQCFGGAGGQHACLVAAELGMETVLIHPLAGVLSAYGIGLADQTILSERAVEQTLSDDLIPALHARARALAREGHAILRDRGADSAQIRTTCMLHLRAQGSDAAIPIALDRIDIMRAAFLSAQGARFGFADPDRALTVDSISVEVTAPGEPACLPSPKGLAPHALTPIDTITLWSDGVPHPTPVYDRQALPASMSITGPALIREAGATTVIEPGWCGMRTPSGNLVLTRLAQSLPARTATDARSDPFLLEVFNSLFMNIAEQAGAVLQNLATSVNIKERLDFSCAIFDASGQLVANAPHVPVHLGAMGASVKAILRGRAGRLRPGDVIALNNPANGGTHLPDITVITPVFDEAGLALRFFAACRGHHADIGGLTPGSTPPFSRGLEEEGVVIDDFLLVDQGRFREAAFLDLLASARYPARSPAINLADIRAQIAANARAAAELRHAIDRHGWPRVNAYMAHVMNNAEASIRALIATLSDGCFVTELDDGAPLKVAIRIDRLARAAVIDFSGTGRQRPGNFNAPEAVTRAVVLYVLRCLAGADIPLNDGCLKPITLIIPPGSFLCPTADAAVVAGNTEISQAVCNALLAALGVQAASQGTMNNFVFGDDKRQYYETICGGAGAGPDFDGQSAVHTHMTNTRMTDPEILERRLPVHVEEFSIRRNSGGTGRRRGGDGAIRSLRFLEPMQAAIVAGSRRIAPYGRDGGEAGQPGAQYLTRADGTVVTLSGTDSAELWPGDVLTIATPGGGGFGRK
jgi:5-oxoprolinase (ATP-hydrolysing)